VRDVSQSMYLGILKFNIYLFCLIVATRGGLLRQMSLVSLVNALLWVPSLSIFLSLVGAVAPLMRSRLVCT